MKDWSPDFVIGFICGILATLLAFNIYALVLASRGGLNEKIDRRIEYRVPNSLLRPLP